MTRSRAGRGPRAWVARMPHSTSRVGRPATASTTPKPRTAVPGSMPSTLMRPLGSGLGLCQLRRVDIEVGEDFRHVLQVLQALDQLEDPFRVGAFDLHRVPRYHGEL